MGIRDAICRNKGYLHNKNPNIIVLVPRNKCGFFKRNIAPYIDMNVQRYIGHCRELKEWEVKDLLNKDMIDVVFVMNHHQSYCLMKKFIHTGLKMNEHIFKIE